MCNSTFEESHNLRPALLSLCFRRFQLNRRDDPLCQSSHHLQAPFLHGARSSSTNRSVRAQSVVLNNIQERTLIHRGPRRDHCLTPRCARPGCPFRRCPCAAPRVAPPATSDCPCQLGGVGGARPASRALRSLTWGLSRFRVGLQRGRRVRGPRSKLFQA